MRIGAKILFLFIGLALSSFFLATFALAAPSAPQNVVNHATRECAEIWPGDECRTCAPAAGWELLTEDCPAGYTVLDHPAPTDCYLNASAYCCGTVNSEWSGCLGYPGYHPPVRPWMIPAGLASLVLILALGLLFWVKKRAGQGQR